MPYNEQFSSSDTYPEIITQNDINEGENIIEQVTNMVQKAFKDRHGFFTPYKDIPDFLDNLVAPIGLPIVFGVASGLFLTGSAIASVATVAAFCTAAGAALFDADDLLVMSLGVLSMAALACGVTALVGVALAFATVLSIPYTLTELVTRTAATIICPIVDACCSEDELDNSDFAPAVYPSY